MKKENKKKGGMSLNLSGAPTEAKIIFFQFLIFFATVGTILFQCKGNPITTSQASAGQQYHRGHICQF